MYIISLANAPDHRVQKAATKSCKGEKILKNHVNRKSRGLLHPVHWVVMTINFFCNYFDFPVSDILSDLKPVTLLNSFKKSSHFFCLKFIEK